MTDFYRFLGVAFAWGVLSPLFALFIRSVESYLIRRNVDIAGLDLFSRESWRQYLVRRRARRLSKHAAAQERLSH